MQAKNIIKCRQCNQTISEIPIKNIEGYDIIASCPMCKGIETRSTTERMEIEMKKKNDEIKDLTEKWKVMTAIANDRNKEIVSLMVEIEKIKNPPKEEPAPTPQESVPTTP